jgi:hypothetical protein
MQLRYKCFSSEVTGGDMSKLERLVNDWLEGAHPHIHHMAQSPFGAHLILSFIYDDARARTALAEQAVEVPEVFEQQLQDTALDPMELVTLPEAELPY